MNTARWLRRLGCIAVVAALSACATDPVVPRSPSAVPHYACSPPPMVSRTWMIFFDAGSADLSPRAQAILRELADDMREGGGAIFGGAHMDAREALGRDRGLDLRRADAVRLYLAERGRRARFTVLERHGATLPLVPTAAGVAEPQNRRVELWPIGTGGPERRRRNAACAALVREQCAPDGLRPDPVECRRTVDMMARLVAEY